VEHAENLSAYALGALDPVEARAVRGHLARCPECRWQLDQLTVVKDVLDHVPLEALLDSSPDNEELLLEHTVDKPEPEYPPSADGPASP
jgi:anti-sigma factor RsiW